MAEQLPERRRLSIIIPVLNEAAGLDQLLQELFARNWVAQQSQVIISDGGSTDESLAIAACYPCQIIHSKAGRAAQMNAAAQQAKGQVLLFLHADSQLDADFDGSLQASAGWGFFRLRLSGKALVYRIIESAINLRSRVTEVAGGDQGLYFERRFFESLGGFPPLPLMEDIAISKLARRRCKAVIVTAVITSSSRRWQERGVIRTILLMWSLRLFYWLGVDPARLHKFYYPQRG